MNFKGHLAGGIIVGCVVSSVATHLSAVPALLALKVFLLTVGFSLYPDLDVSSIPQRWFFRGILVLLLFLVVSKYFRIASIIAIVAVLPLISKHRGWTHSVWSAILFPIFLFIGYQHLFVMKIGFDMKYFYKMHKLLSINFWLVLSCSLGWLTHIYLDKLLFKKSGHVPFR